MIIVQSQNTLSRHESGEKIQSHRDELLKEYLEKKKILEQLQRANQKINKLEEENNE